MSDGLPSGRGPHVGSTEDAVAIIKDVAYVNICALFILQKSL